MIPVDLLGIHLEATTNAPVLLLREHAAPHRVLPIFVGAPEADAIQLALNGQEVPRPMTHDLLVDLTRALGASVLAVEITRIADGAFHAVLALHGPGGDRRLDSRPSDAIALAARVDAPVFVADEVLDEAGALLGDADEDDEDGGTPAADPVEIEAAVSEFRDQLAGLTPGDFEAGGDDPDPPEG